ncbi:MAG: hypothetical protein II947_09455 [Bacteroidaceae bacterium]|nr:hypothetical protein [Bacteroidaceae bacterium]
MKKLLIIMLLAFVATAVHSQESNQQLRQLEKYLQEQGFNVGHVQSSGTEEKGVTHRFSAWLYVFGVNPESMYDSKLTAEQNQQRVHVADSINKQRQKRMLDAVDSIRLCFARLGKDASESYLYEYHKNGMDTIKYSLSFKKDNDTLYSYRSGNTVYFHNAREAANFDYVRENRADGGSPSERGNYNHIYSVPNDIEWEGMRPFDHVAFEKRIAPVLKSVKKLKGTKAYPIYWRHDEGFDDNVGTGNLISKTTRQSDYTDKHYGLTTGTFYFIPRACEEEAKALYRQLDSLAYDYVEQHPEQYYRYNFTPGFSYRNLKEMVSGSDIEGDSSYSLSSFADDTGFYILTFTTKGELWIPKDWQKLKSYINGELIERK